MFCFGRGAAERQRIEGRGGPSTPLSPPAAKWGNTEDVISDISSDGKYEIDIPTPKEFTLANIANLRYIDSDKQDEDSVDGTDETEAFECGGIDEDICPGLKEALLIRDTVIKIAPTRAGLFEWGSNKSLNNGGSPVGSAPGPGPRPRIIDNLSGERVGARGPASSADLADRLGSQLLYTRQESEESTFSNDLKTDMNPPSSAAPAPPPGPRFKLLPEGDIQLCQLNHTRTLISKILSSKFLRRWETHHLTLGATSISSRTPCGFLEPLLPYTCMEEVYSISRWDASHKYCLRIVVRDGSLLLQAKNAYTRDQWFHSIQWKRNLYKYRNILLQSTRKEVVLKELRNMVDYVMCTPLQDESITSEPLEIISQLLAEEQRWSGGDDSSGAALRASGPLLAAAPLPAPLAAALARHCRARPRSPRLRDTLALVAARILKHNVDFGKAPHLRRLVQEYISALNHQNGGEEVVRSWVRSVHGAGPICPHPRVLPNLAAACLAALHQLPPPPEEASDHPSDFHKFGSTPRLPTPRNSSPITIPTVRLQTDGITSSPPPTPIMYASPAVSVGNSPPATPASRRASGCPSISSANISPIVSNNTSPFGTPATHSLQASFRSESPSDTPAICSPFADPATFSTPSTLATIPTISYTPRISPTRESDATSIQDEEETHNNNIFHMTAEMVKNVRNDSSSQYSAAEEMEVTNNLLTVTGSEIAWTDDKDLVCFANVIKYMSEYIDWAEGLGALLQPVPVPARALQQPRAGRALAAAALALGRDPRCAVHRRVLPLRPPRPGWLHLLCPTRPGAHPDHAQLWGDMLETLLNCCCKRKRFLTELTQMLPACLLLALRAHPAGLEALCLMLEWELLGDEQQRLEAVQALRSSAPGRRALHQTCQKQVHLKKLQQKGGPRRLTLPSRATDADVARLLSAGSFGNLECLSLAFTHVTSAVAEQLIKLPSLRYLNLWATQFGDAGVLLIAEHLQHLQVLNLCETPVSDNGIAALSGLPSLRKLNLNSTKLTAATWARLRPCLPALQESDVRYTDAW